MSRSLSFRLLAYVLIPLLMALGVFGVLVLRALEGNFERRLQRDAQLVARALQHPVSHALERGQPEMIAHALSSALQIGQVYGAYLYDDKGQLLFESGGTEGRPPPASARRLAEHDHGAGRYGQMGQEEVYSYFVPVRLDAERVGILEITRHKRDFVRFMGKLRAQALGVLTLTGIVMGFIAIAGYRGALGAGLDQLLASIRRIQEGDDEHRADEVGPREVTTLVEAFNRMLDSLRAAEQRAAKEHDDRLGLQIRLVESEKLAAIGDLAAGIAHELGTPLATVRGRVQRVLRRTDLPTQARQELDGLAREIRRMERLVRQVLDFGRGDAGNRRACQAEALASMAFHAVEEEAATAGVQITLASDDVSLIVEASVARVEQALVNLLRNAIQALEPEGGGEVTLRIKGADGSIVFEVEDDGPGVPERIAPRIFEPFFTTKQAREGTGLGLGIVRAVAREHGGSVELRNGHSGGATFAIRLPAATLAEETAR